MLITASQVITIAINDKNLQTAKIKDVIIDVAQEGYIRPVLGEDFYKEIVLQKEAGTLTADNTTLLEDYLQPALAFFVKFEAMPDIMLQLTNMGIQLPDTHYSGAGTDKQRGLSRDTAKKHGTTLIDKMITYIEYEKEENNKFPLYYYSDNIKNNVTVKGGIIF